jgi:hypothetical protein
MKANLKYILITVKEIKKNFVIYHDGLFKQVVEMLPTGDIVLMNPDIDEDGSHKCSLTTFDEISKSVVKFLAELPKGATFPIIHGDFSDIVNNFNTREKIEKITKKNLIIEGHIEAILTLPKKDDIVEIINTRTLDSFGITGGKEDRIGTIVESNKHVFKVLMNNGRTLTIKRGTFEIINNINSKNVFQIDR